MTIQSPALKSVLVKPRVKGIRNLFTHQAFRRVRPFRPDNIKAVMDVNDCRVIFGRKVANVHACFLFTTTTTRQLPPGRASPHIEVLFRFLHWSYKQSLVQFPGSPA